MNRDDQHRADVEWHGRWADLALAVLAACIPAILAACAP